MIYISQCCINTTYLFSLKMNNRMKTEYTKYCDGNGVRIPYNSLLDFTWWDKSVDGSEVEHHFPCKIRRRKTGDIFDFYPRSPYGGRTHKLTALEWCEDDLLLVDDSIGCFNNKSCQRSCRRKDIVVRGLGVNGDEVCRGSLYYLQKK